MSAKNQRDLEFVILKVEVPSLQKKKTTSHLLRTVLLWPRCAIAQKVCEKKVDLSAGVFNFSTESWCQKILFKESVEDLFGLEISLTDSLSSKDLENFNRFLIGKTLKISATEIKNKLPIGELFSLPVLYFSQEFLKSKALSMIVKGSLDLSIQQFAETDYLEFDIPLYSERKLTRRRTHGTRKDHIYHEHKVLLDRGDPDGIVKIAVKAFARK